VIDLGEQILLPGLINAHCHLDYTMMRGKIPRQPSFANWIRAINSEKEKLSADDYIASINSGYAEAKRFGTTTIANLIAFPELIAKIRPPIRTWWFAELIDVRDPSKAASLVNRATKLLKSTEHWGLAPHALFTASPDLIQRCEKIASDTNALLTTHLAESEEELQMSCDRSGSLHDFLRSLGVELFEAEGRTPIEQMLNSTARLHDRWLLVHLNALLDSDLEQLAAVETKPQIVHCPRSHEYFGHPPFAFAALRKLGFNICLGTDSLASNSDLSLFAEMRQFQRTHPDVSAREIVELITVNPAAALKQENALGRIRSGFYADFITIPEIAGPNVFEQIIAFAGAAPSVL
jgi:cytosine/adenosine deaminase-related metal-dependent hydrolase